MFRRSFRIILQFVGVLILGMLVAGVIFVWRLSAGPISVAYLTPYFEVALSASDGSYAVQLNDTILDWSDEARTLNVKLLGARVLDSEKDVILQVPELYVSLSASALLQGEIAPRSLSVVRPSLRITRNESGDLDLGAEGEAVTASDGAAWKLSEILTGQAAGQPLNYLQRVNILNAHLAIDDRLLGIQWSAPDVNISIVRTPAGLSGITDLDLKVGDQIASMQVNAEYRLGSGEFTLSLGFAELRPSALASVSERLAMLEPFDVPLGGTLLMEISRDGEMKRSEFNLAGGVGRIAMTAPVVVDVAVESSRIRGTFEAAEGTVKIDEFILGFGDKGSVTLPAPIDHTFPARELSVFGASFSTETGQLDIPIYRLALDRPNVEGSVTARPTEDSFNLDITAVGTRFTFDDIAKYWPAKLGSNPHIWITKHMSSGRITDMRASTALTWSKDSGFGLVSINGEINANDLVVDYLPPLPKILKGAAKATFDQYKFNIAVLGGEAGGLTVREGRVIISDLEKHDQWTDLDLRIAGPFAATLATLDSEPFRFARAVGLSPRAATGDTNTRLKMRFIAENRLTVDEIKINAESNIKGAGLPAIAFGLDLADGDVKLVVDNAGMDVKGTAVLGGLPSEIEWRQNFGKKVQFETRYRVKTLADADVWRAKIGANWALLGPDRLSGPIGAELVATIAPGGAGTVNADIALDQARLSVAPLGYDKPGGEAARASIEAALNQGKIVGLPKISLAGKDIAVDANAAFASDGSFASAQIGRLVTGATDVAGNVFPRAGGWAIDLRGRQLDLKQYMEDETPEDPSKPRGDSLAISVNVDKVRLYDERYLGKTEGTIFNDGLVVREARLNGVMSEGGSLKIEVVPDGAGRKVLLSSDNAGGVLRAFDINDNVVGGRLNITGSYVGMVPAACLGGRVAIDDYRIRNAPIMARLLNVASIVGLLDALGGEGIRFDTLRVPFTRKDGITRFENAKANGISIGLTASGSTNSRDDTIDVEGSIIPANVLNGVLGKIPLVGGLFGGEGGIFAINYKVAGNEKDPDVTANPLTVLTPGFTRNIFNLFDKDEVAPIGCPKAS